MSDIRPPRRSYDELFDDFNDFVRWAKESRQQASDAIVAAQREAELARDYQALERTGKADTAFWLWQAQREIDKLAKEYGPDPRPYSDLDRTARETAQALARFVKQIEEIKALKESTQ